MDQPKVSITAETAGKAPTRPNLERQRHYESAFWCLYIVVRAFEQKVAISAETVGKVQTLRF
jgi:hypothetical protein